MKEAILRIVVDYRERACAVPAFLEATPGVQVDFTQLLKGDYLVADKVYFERKTMRDFAISLIDGRLFSQARRLTSNRPRRHDFGYDTFPLRSISRG